VELYQLTACEADTLLRKGEISSQELTKAVLDRVDQVEDKVKGYLTVCRELALNRAEIIDSRRAGGEELPLLAGVPMVLKDNICTEGIPTTCASKILNKFIPPYNATVVEHLNKAGAVLVGKTNMDEFAMGSSTEHSGFYPTCNPWDLERVPGGSSGGSAAVVASGEALYALGSDTGGSIRQPAAFCGVVGFKPTYGRVSRYGLIAFASSLDQIGPLTKDVKDCALVMNIIAHYDRRDSTSVDQPTPDYTKFLHRGVEGIRFGIPKEYFGEGIAAGVKQQVEKGIKLLEKMGAKVGETTLPHTEYALPAYYLIAPAEASSNLARYDGVQYGLRVESDDLVEQFFKTRSEGFGPEVKRRIMLGTYALSSGYYDAYYLKALKVRTLIRQDFDRAFADYDLLVTPTTPSVSFRRGEKATPLQMYLNDVYTLPINLAGLPAISLPCGLSDGMPVGLQMIGPPFSEGMIIQAAAAFEQELGFTARAQL